MLDMRAEICQTAADMLTLHMLAWHCICEAEADDVAGHEGRQLSQAKLYRAEDNTPRL